jgi:hypothetical protein
MLMCKGTFQEHLLYRVCFSLAICIEGESPNCALVNQAEKKNAFLCLCIAPLWGDSGSDKTLANEPTLSLPLLSFAGVRADRMKAGVWCQGWWQEECRGSAFLAKSFGARGGVGPGAGAASHPPWSRVQ